MFDSSWNYMTLAITSQDPDVEGRIYLCFGGKRHFLLDPRYLSPFNINFPNDVRVMSAKDLLGLRPGQDVPYPWSSSDLQGIHMDAPSGSVRSLAAIELRGFGLEIGALGSPYPVPLHCSVMYADRYSYYELLSTYPEQRDKIVIPTIKSSFEKLDGVSDNSLDFVVASHVIEHTSDPIGAIANAYKKLRSGGHLVLAVPDKNRTFDRNRPLTSLKHLIADYENPSHERDAENFKEYMSLAVGVPESRFEETWKASWEARESIHYHTWDYSSFGEMMDWFDGNVARWKNRWSHPTLPHEIDDFEFYYTLRK